MVQNVLAEPFATNCAGVAFDIGVFLGLAGLVVVEPDGPVSQPIP